MKKCFDVFTYAQLSDEAKRAAREWFRDASAGDLHHDFIFSDVEAIAPLLGIDLATRPVKLMNGSTRYDPAIFYSLSYSQSDGASFEGTWRAESFPKTKRGRARACPVKDYAPRDKTLARICRELSRLAREFPDLVAVISDHPYYGMRAECESEKWSAAEYPEQGDRDEARVAQFEQAARDVKKALRDFASWIYYAVRGEYEYQQSDEVIAETIEANEYLFTREGARSVIL